MADARTLAGDLEARASIPEAPDRERLRGYAVPAVSFRSGHVLAMRRMPATSIGPGYTSLWHRDPSGRWTIYQDVDPHLGCPRAFGPSIDAAVRAPIDLEWTGPSRFAMGVETDAVRLRWEVPLRTTPVTRLVNGVLGVLPRSVRRHPRVAAAMGPVAGAILRAGNVALSGAVPSGQGFLADMRRIWLIGASTATVDGEDVGEPGPLPEQARMGDFWLPQRGLFASVDAYFEPYDPARHEQVASRAERS